MFSRLCPHLSASGIERRAECGERRVKRDERMRVVASVLADKYAITTEHLRSSIIYSAVMRRVKYLRH